MSPFEFLATPIGVFVTLVFVALVFVIVRMTTESGKHQQRVRSALMTAAKRQAEGRFIVVIALRRRGASLEQAFEHLAAQAYRKLAVVVIAYHTAGKHARRDVNALARQHGLSVRVVTHRKGLDMHAVIRKQPPADFVMTFDADDRLTTDFFRNASFAFATGVDALEVRQVSRPGISLVSAWRSIRDVFAQMIRMLWAQPLHAVGLTDSIIVRRRIMLRAKPYTASRLLFESIGSIHGKVRAGTPTWRSLVVFVVLTVVLVALAVTTPLAVLGYSTLLIGGVAVFAAALVVIQTRGLSGWDKVQMVALLPFYALYELGALIGRVIRLLRRTIQTQRRPRRSAPRLQRVHIR